MSWLGTGAPVFIVGGVSYTYPRPNAGGRADKMFVPEVQDQWTNLDGEILEGELRWRIEDKITWTALTAVQIETLVGWFAARKTVYYRPHADTSWQWACRIMDIVNPRNIVTASHEEFTIELKSIQLIDALPQPTAGVTARRLTGVIA